MDEPGHMSVEEFRTQGHRMVDAIADYWRRVGGMPVLCRRAPGETAAMLPAHAPERGIGSAATGTAGEQPQGGRDSWDAIFADIERIVLPGLTHWQHPNFHAYFSANASFPAILGDLLSTGLGVQGMLWATSPACTEIETRVLDWLGELIGLPAAFLSTAPSGGRAGAAESGSGGGGGVIQGTASEAAVVALLAARRRVRAGGGPRADATGAVVYASTQAHSSIVRAAMITGLAAGPDDHANIRLIETDSAHAMRPDALDRAMRADLAAGRRPCFVCATIGTTGTTAVDPLGAIAGVIARVAADHPGAPVPWLHVDAAHAGAALVCPEFRWMSAGIEHADSFCFNPHKWLLTSFDCDCFWTRDRRSLLDALSITPEYLRNAASASGSVIDYRDWQIPLGRRFRSLKLWFVLRHYGAEGLRAYIRGHVALAAWFEARARADERFEVVAPRTVNLVCFRLRPAPGESPEATDARNRALLDRLNASGRLYLTHTAVPVGGGASGHAAYVLRFCVGSTLTREEHVRRAWDLIDAAADGRAVE